MSFRKPLLAVPITLGALLVLLIASAPAQARAKWFPRNQTRSGWAKSNVPSKVGPYEPNANPNIRKGTKICLHGDAGAGVAFAGFSEGQGSATDARRRRDCELHPRRRKQRRGDLHAVARNCKSTWSAKGKPSAKKVETRHIGPANRNIRKA